MEKQRRLRTWLFNLVDSGKVENLEWLNEEKSLFRIPWKHESRNDWLPAHAQVFTEWALFTGKYRAGIDKPDYKMFKTRLRCAFNKAPDIEEEVELRKYKGPSPYRVYKLLPCDKKPKKLTMSPSTSSTPIPPMTITQPPVTVEQMQDGNSSKTTLNALAEKIKNRMDLLQAVESERQQQEDGTWSQEADIVKDVEMSEDGTCQIPTEVANKYSHEEMEPEEKPEHHRPEERACVETPESEERVALTEDCVEKSVEQVDGHSSSQSLILLQSTRCNLLKNMYELQRNGFLCDLLLRASGGNVIPVHANVMCGSSSFFKEKVDHWDIGHSGDTAGGCMVLDFEEVPYEVLNSIIQFIYMGEFEVGRETLQQILQASRDMQLDDLTILCEHVLKALRGSFVDEKTKKPVLPKQPPLMASSDKSQDVNTKVQTPSAAPIPAFLCQKEATSPIVIRPQNTKQTKQIANDIIPNPEVTQESLPPTHISPPAAISGIGSWHIPHQGQPEYLRSNPDNRESRMSTLANVVTRSLPIHFPENALHLNSKPMGTRTMEPQVSGQGAVGSYPNRSYQHAVISSSQHTAVSNFITTSSAMSNPLHVLCQAVDETIRSESQSDEDVNGEAHMATQDMLTAGKTFDHHLLPSRDQRGTPDANKQVQQPKQLVQAIPPVVLHKPVDLQKHLVPQPPAIQPQPESCVPQELTLTVRDTGRARSSPGQTLLPPPTEGNHGLPKKDVDLHRCKYCSKAFQQTISRNRHQSHCVQNADKLNSLSSGIVPSVQKNSSEGNSRKKDQFSVPEETIQEIVQRIKDKAGPEGYVPQTLPLAGVKKASQGRNGRRARRNNRKYRKKVFRPKDVIVIDDEERSNSNCTKEGARNEGVNKGEERTANGITATQDKAAVDKTSGLPKPKRQKTLDGKVKDDPEVAASLKEVTTKKTLNSSKKNGHHKVNVTCQECGLRMSSVDQVEQHRDCCRAPRTNLNHICHQCGKMFAEEEQLDQHIMRHDKLRALTCKQCKKVCKSGLLLKLHIEVHASHKMKFSCMACGKCFMTKRKLEHHIHQHLGGRAEKQDKAREYECDICKETFKQKSLLSRHLTTHTNMLKEESSFQSENKSSLLNVVKKWDSGEKGHNKSEIYKPLSVKVDEHVVKRPMSGIPDAHQFVTNAHHDLEATETRSYAPSTPDGQSSPRSTAKKCQICNEIFSDSVKKMVHLMSHFQVHTDPGKVICQVCLSTIDKDAISAHELSHAKETPLQCPHCDGAFSDSTELNCHVNDDHSDNGIVTDHACEKCAEVFTSREELTEHFLIHHATSKPKEPLVCEVCHRVFNSKHAVNDYKRHMYSHTGEKPVACRFCEKGFKDYSGRSQHEKRVHNRGPMSRGRSRANKAGSNAFMENIQPPPVPASGSSHNTHGPPPLVNISMLSEEVKNQFFPSLRHADIQNPSSGSNSRDMTSAEDTISVHIDQRDPHPQNQRTEGVGEHSENLSEEEDLSIMVALKGESPPLEPSVVKKHSYEKELAYQQSLVPRNHLPIVAPPSYRPTLLKSQPPHLPHPPPPPTQGLFPHYTLPNMAHPPQEVLPIQGRGPPLNTGILLQTSMGPHGHVQYTLAPGPPVELLSHLTRSKANPIISPPGGTSFFHNSHTVGESRPHPMNQGAMVATTASAQRPVTTGFARVGNQLKMSNMVAPIVRHQPSALKPMESCDKGATVDKLGEITTEEQTKPSFYPTLPKKRPYLPQTSAGEQV